MVDDFMPQFGDDFSLSFLTQENIIYLADAGISCNYLFIYENSL